MRTSDKSEFRKVILIVALGFVVGMGLLLYIVSTGL